MARRADVFQSKVLQRLYPPTRNVEKEPSPPRIVEALAKKPHAKRDAAKSQSAANPGRRLYTVLPPPADYNIHSQESVTLPQLESINSAEDPAAVEKAHDGDEQSDEGKEAEEQQWRKRRRRKRKQGSEKHGEATGSESSRDQSQAAEDEGGERISKNKRRKLKKKRHKEKLLSMGLMPQAAALEFTYQKEEEEEEEEEDNERRAAEVSDFLRTTMEIYMSDYEAPRLSATVDDLLGGIAGGCKHHSVLKQLYDLKVFVQRHERDKLENALKVLDNSSSMTAEEIAAVVSLFQYWITDILPMRGGEKTMLSTTHP
ncbi:glutamate-rich protein 1 isoform X2 [Mugil cephalus]|uniref:glutamate-rich protein 1 isoform X2 n=1 Tax=Mugil cephalus TaxID=48193 RepID=UPI001FB6F4D5|nr:glutamate-rich protein 1 isoform X2 [Mugil cephalus]